MKNTLLKVISHLNACFHWPSHLLISSPKKINSWWYLCLWLSVFSKVTITLKVSPKDTLVNKYLFRVELSKTFQKFYTSDANSCYISHPKPLLIYSSQLCTVGLHQTLGYNTGLKICVWLMTSQGGPGPLFSFTAFNSPWFHTQAAFSFLTHTSDSASEKYLFYPEQPSSPFPLTYTDTGMNHSIHLPFLNITRVLALFQYVQISSVLKDFWKLSTTDADAVQLTPLAIRLENQGLDHSYN